MVVNINALRRLSDDHLRALVSSIPRALAHYIAFYSQETLDNWGPTLDSRDIEQVTFSPDELRRLRAQVTQPTAEAWIQQMTALGLPGRELYDLVIGTLD